MGTLRHTHAVLSIRQQKAIRDGARHKSVDHVVHHETLRRRHRYPQEGTRYSVPSPVNKTAEAHETQHDQFERMRAVTTERRDMRRPAHTSCGVSVPETHRQARNHTTLQSQIVHDDTART